MNLSPHFTLEEFTHSQTAARMGLDNTPHATTVAALSATAAGMEMVRAALGSRPIVISSGYRSPTLNTVARGSRRSQHLPRAGVRWRVLAAQPAPAGGGV